MYLIYLIQTTINHYTIKLHQKRREEVGKRSIHSTIQQLYLSSVLRH